MFSSFLFPNSGKMLQTTASVFVVKIGGTSNSSIFRKISDKIVNKLLIKLLQKKTLVDVTLSISKAKE